MIHILLHLVTIVFLTHWDRATHICVGNLTIIASDNGLLSGRRQAIIWTNVGILSIGPLGTNSNEISIEILSFPVKKMRLKVSSAKWRPFYLALNVLIPWWLQFVTKVLCDSIMFCNKIDGRIGKYSAAPHLLLGRRWVIPCLTPKSVLNTIWALYCSMTRYFRTVIIIDYLARHSEVFCMKIHTISVWWMTHACQNICISYYVTWSFPRRQNDSQ